MRNRKKIAMGVVLSLGALTAFALGAPRNGHKLATPFDVRTDTLRRTVHIARHEAGHAAGAPPGPGRRPGVAGSPAPRLAVAAAGPGFGHGSVTSRSSGTHGRSVHGPVTAHHRPVSSRASGAEPHRTAAAHPAPTPVSTRSSGAGAPQPTSNSVTSRSSGRGGSSSHHVTSRSSGGHGEHEDDGGGDHEGHGGGDD